MNDDSNFLIEDVVYKLKLYIILAQNLLYNKRTFLPSPRSSLMKKAIRYHFDDNSLVALEVIEKGDAIEIDGVATGYTALDSLPMGHKIAACDIKKGELIGRQ